MINVLKRDGRREPYEQNKVFRVLEWAAEGLKVSPSLVELNARLQLEDGIKTQDIQTALIQAAHNQISVRTPEYDVMAGRLAMFDLYKEVFGGYTFPNLFDFVQDMLDLGLYDEEIVGAYSMEEWKEMSTWLDHNRDLNTAYAGVTQLIGKYLLKTRDVLTGKTKIHETPQFAFIMIAAAGYHRYTEDRMLWVRRMYEALSTSKISLPTPVMVGLRGNMKQFSSCVVIDAGDSLETMGAASSIVLKYISQRAGIGINLSAIRAVGSSIRGSEVMHTGVTPFARFFQSAVKSCSQGGVRGGSATATFLGWHMEFQDLVVLKNNRGVQDNRVRHLDYNVLVNRLFYERLIAGGNITLFSPSEVPGLYDAFFEDQEEFTRLYQLYEADPAIRKVTMTAADWWAALSSERASTGRIYLQNIDHTNSHSAFNPAYAPIRQSNLCMEIALPTSPVSNILADDGEVALCTLSAFNVGKITEAEIPELAELLVRFLNELLDYQSYPVIAAQQATMRRRPLGVGVINLAYWAAKHGYRYTDGTMLKPLHRLFERLQFSLLTASNKLAQEQGACPAFDETSYAQGLLPIDTYKAEVDELVAPEYHCDWEGLREAIAQYGLRNSTLMALMPSETSSQVSNATNGIEPPRSLVTIKQSKTSTTRQAVPELEKLKDAYETAWTPGMTRGCINNAAVIQKFADQTISLNTYYDPKHFGGAVPQATVIQDLFHGYRLGIKTWYYHNTQDGSDEATVDLHTAIEQEDDGCESGACKI